MRNVLYRGYNLSEEYVDGINTMRTCAPEIYLRSSECVPAEEMLEEKDSCRKHSQEHGEEKLLAQVVVLETSYMLKTTAAVRLVALQDELRLVKRYMENSSEQVNGLGTYYAKLTATIYNRVHDILGEKNMTFGNPTILDFLYKQQMLTVNLGDNSIGKKIRLGSEIETVGLPSQITLERMICPIPSIIWAERHQIEGIITEAKVNGAFLSYADEFSKIFSRLEESNYDVFYDRNVV